MNILQNRIESYQNNSVKWPHGGKQYHKTETFAKAGFYFMRRPKAVDSVRCFMCDIELSHWKQGQSPFSRHSAESPQCPWSLLNFPDASNRSLTVDEKNPITQPQHRVMRAARLATFNHHHYWPPNKSVKTRRFQAASKLADAGFYFTPTLENTARIKCPYCKITLLEPEKSLDALGKHKELNNTCAFFQRTLSIRAKNRRDTATSTASTETFKTAASQLDNDNIVEESTIPQKRKQPKETPMENEDKDDDSIWDINKAFEIPMHVKKPTVTYGTKSLIKKNRHRVLPSSSKRTNVDIFSNLELKSSSLIERPIEKTSNKKPALIEKPKKVMPKKDKPQRPSKRSKQGLVVKDKPVSSSPSLPALIEPPPSSSTAVAVPSSSVTAAPSSSAPPLSIIAPSPPGITQEDEYALMSPTFPPPEPLFVEQNHSSLKEIPIQFNEPLNIAKPVVISSSTSSPPPSPPPPPPRSADIFSDENVDPARSKDKGKGRAVEHSIVPKKKPISLSKSRKPAAAATNIPATPSAPTAPTASSSPSRKRNSDVAASIAKQMQYLQSTPMNSVHKTVDFLDIFGDCPLSPITSDNTSNTRMRTPATSVVGGGGRTHNLITADGQRRALPSQTATSTPKPKPTPPTLSLKTNSAPLVTGDQKKMSVEAYLQYIVDENITKVREQGDQFIALIKERSDTIKQKLLQQKD